MHSKTQRALNFSVCIYMHNRELVLTNYECLREALKNMNGAFLAVI